MQPDPAPRAPTWSSGARARSCWGRLSSRGLRRARSSGRAPPAPGPATPWRRCRCRRAAADRTRCRAGCACATSIARDARGERERHVDAGRDAGRRDDLAALDDALLNGIGAELCQVAHGAPVGGGVHALQQAGRRQHERAGAHRGGPLRRGMDSTHPVELAAGRSSWRACRGRRAPPARRRWTRRRRRRPRRRPCPCRCGTSALLADEDDLRTGEAGEHLVRADGVEGGETVEESDGDLHALSLSGSGARK